MDRAALWQRAGAATALTAAHARSTACRVGRRAAAVAAATGGRRGRRAMHAAGQAALLEQAAKYFPGGSNGNSIYQDVVISHGKGSRVYDSDGREYVDYVMGGGPMMLGHAHPAIVEAVSKQMPLGCSYFGMNEVIIEHAALLCASVPCAEQVRYCSSGTEATLFALRAARAISGRPKVVKFEGGYHGHNDIALMSLTPDSLRPFPTPHSGSLGISKAIEAVSGIPSTTHTHSANAARPDSSLRHVVASSCSCATGFCSLSIQTVTACVTFSGNAYCSIQRYRNDGSHP